MEFRINDFGNKSSDFLVVHDNLEKPVNVEVMGGGFILVIGEERSVCPVYEQEFLNQFDCVITNRDDIKHDNIIRTFYLHPWRVRRTYDQLTEQPDPVKSLNLSAIISNLSTTPMQASRLEMMRNLKQQYGEDLHWFSKGGNSFLENKWDGLAPYRYSIAVENSAYTNYFTEKISDCFLAGAMPIYAGCPNIADFFDERSFIRIDLKNIIGSKAIIDEAIKGELYFRSMKYLKDSKSLVLNKYQFIAALENILLNFPKSHAKVKRKLLPQSYFSSMGRKMSQYASKFLKW